MVADRGPRWLWRANGSSRDGDLGTKKNEGPVLGSGSHLLRLREATKVRSSPNGVVSLTSEKLQKLILHCKSRRSQDVLLELLAFASFLPFVPTAQPLSASRAQAPRRPPPPESFPRRSTPPRAPPMAAPLGAPSLDGRHRPELPPWLRPSDPVLTERHGRCSGPRATSPWADPAGASSLGGATGGRRRSKLPPLTARPELRSLTSALDKPPQTD